MEPVGPRNAGLGQSAPPADGFQASPRTPKLQAMPAVSLAEAPVAEPAPEAAEAQPRPAPHQPDRPWPRRRRRGLVTVGRLAAACVVLVVLLHGGFFAWLSVERHNAFRTHAEDLGFTDQVIWNWLRWQAFRFSIYEKAEFDTDADVRKLVRPDSFLAFHVEPMTILFSPLYWIWSDVRAILAAQAALFALGGIPAARLAARRLGSPWAGVAASAAYALNPVGHWMLVSDFHTVTLATPILLAMVDWLDEGRRVPFVLGGLLAMSAKEEVGLAVAALGLVAALRPRTRVAGILAAVLGVGWSVACVTYIIPRYSGGEVSPFTARYAHLGGQPGEALLTLLRDPSVYFDTLTRPMVLEYLATLALVGLPLALLAPEVLATAGLSLTLNVLSSTPWMASGRAHYSGVVLGVVLAAAIVGAGRLRRWLPFIVGWFASRGRRPQAVRALSLGPVLAALLVVGAAVAYAREGIGPLADGFVLPVADRHEAAARRILAQVPPGARVSASSSLVPHLTHRPDVYLFPTEREADFVILDVAASPFPTSAGDVYLRTLPKLTFGDWYLVDADHGVVLLERWLWPSTPLPDRFFDFARYAGPPPTGPPLATYLDGALELVAAELRPTGNLGPRGPLGKLTTVWRTTRKLETRPRPRLLVDYGNGETAEHADFAALWWYPPERWRVGELVQLELDGLSLREMAGWWATVPPPEPLATGRPAPAPLPQAQQTGQERFRLGELTVLVRRDPWRLSVLDPRGALLWQESELSEGDRRGPLGFEVDGRDWWHLARLESWRPLPDGFELRAATDDPSGRVAIVTLESLGPRELRLTLGFDNPSGVTTLGQAFPTPPDERFVGFGERFTGVDQRGRVVWTWADDRRAAGYGDSTYAPVPFFISSLGYAMLLETDNWSVYDLAAERPDRASWEAQGNGLSLVFSYGPTPRQLVQAHVARTGLPPLPPIWAFGVVKTAIGGQEQVLQEARRLRELDVPISAIYAYDVKDDLSNIGWPHVSFRGKRAGPYPDPRAFTDELHRLGYKALAYHTADFHVGTPAYDFPARQGFFVRDPDGKPYVHPGFKISWVDFTNPAAVNWWGVLWRRSLGELGFDGGMLDLGELMPIDARFANGKTGGELHNRYTALYHEAALNSARAVKPDAVLFTRSGTHGAQAHQLSQWSGDPVLDWSETNGFRSIVPAALSFGLSGFPYFHTEVAGYLATNLSREAERELWMRWLQLGAFTSLLRDQYGDHQIATEPVEFWSDDGTIEAFRFYAKLHNRLVPYLYSYAKVASETGLPLMRHLALGWPDQPRAWEEEQSYTLGDELLVAPVVDPGARLRRVYLPPGAWVDFWNGTLWQGDREITADAPLDRLPVFVKAGAILPLATDFDTLVPAGEPGLRTWDGSLTVRVATHDGPIESRFDLYDGTKLTYRADAKESVFRRQGPPSERHVEVRLPSAAEPAHVLIDGAATPNWRFENGEVVVDLLSGAEAVTVMR